MFVIFSLSLNFFIAPWQGILGPGFVSTLRRIFLAGVSSLLTFVAGDFSFVSPSSLVWGRGLVTQSAMILLCFSFFLRFLCSLLHWLPPKTPENDPTVVVKELLAGWVFDVVFCLIYSCFYLTYSLP